MAANFCSRWLEENERENKLCKKSSPIGGGDENSDSENQDGDSNNVPVAQHPNEVIYENNEFRLVVRNSPVKRATKFKLEDHQFTLLVVPKTTRTSPPLVEILQFLEEGFNSILQEVKQFFNPNEHRIAYLTLYQDPMVYWDKLT